MGKSEFFITKKQLNKILDTYSSRPGEFQLFGTPEYDKISFKSCVIKGFILVIQPSEDDIYVNLTNLRGIRTVTDVWKLVDLNDEPEFQYRCRPGMEMASEVVEGYEQQLRELEQKIRMLQEAYGKLVAERYVLNATRKIGRPKLDMNVVTGIQEDLKSGLSIRMVAKKYNISTTTVQKYKGGKS